MGEILHRKHCLKRQTSTSEIHVCRFGEGRYQAFFKEPCNQTLGSSHKKREFSACLNARELMREKKFDRGENFLPKHRPNRKTPARKKKYTCVNLREGQN